MIWLFAVLNILDLATTYVALTWFGLVESNPIARYLIAQYGFAILIAAKSLLVGYTLICYMVLARRWVYLLRVYQNITVWIYIVVVAWNVRTLLLYGAMT